MCHRPRDIPSNEYSSILSRFAFDIPLSGQLRIHVLRHHLAALL